MLGNKIASEAAKMITKITPTWLLAAYCIAIIWRERRRKQASEK